MAYPARRLPSPRAMIVAPQPEAVEAGQAMLAAGGNALDALLACGLAQGVVDPMMCGIGGLGVLTLYDPRTRETVVLDGLSTCPAGCTPAMWQDVFLGECSDGYGYVMKGHVNELGHTAVTTPGALRVYADAHARFGRATWNTLFEHAIALAEEGFLVRPHMHAIFTMDEQRYGRLPWTRKLAHTEEGRELYMRPDGTAKRPGDQVRNPALARTLSGIAAGGVENFYTGALARLMADDMARHGGLMTAQDLADFRTRTQAPMWLTWRRWRFALPAPPAGGIVVGEALRILEHFDLAALGHNSPEYIRVLAEAMKIAGRDKEEHIGDPAFIPPPLDRLLGDAYTSDCAARIRRGEKTSLARVTSDAANTTTISCADADGMVASMTHTLGTASGVIPPGTGFMLNGAMNWYDPRPGRAGSIAPGKKRFSSMAPMIVFEADRPVMTLGAPGAAWIGVALLQVVLNVLEFGMTMQEAVMAPRF
ncbi:MAG: gamma-glutamyltransferase, partial [Acetobacteraceae bacterium]|nr:gamma-glutamyltransferase [Acetobacteraceae bacterium]